MKKLDRAFGKLSILFMLALVFVFVGSVFAAEVVPLSYSWWPGTTAGGDDAGLTKLIDGDYGTTSPVNFNEPEFVDWYRPYWPYVLFDLGASVVTSSVTVSCVNYVPWGISPANNFQIQYSNDLSNWSSAYVFTYTPSTPSVPVIEKSTAVTGDHTARYVLLKFWHTGSANEPWMFVDEIDFYNSDPVPEPTSMLALLSGLGGLSAFALRRRA